MFANEDKTSTSSAFSKLHKVIGTVLQMFANFQGSNAICSEFCTVVLKNQRKFVKSHERKPASAEVRRFLLRNFGESDITHVF
jgi:hypothetical protein